jgi:hypothetical protein
MKEDNRVILNYHRGLCVYVQDDNFLTNYENLVTDYDILVADYDILVTGYDILVAGYDILVTDYGNIVSDDVDNVVIEEVHFVVDLFKYLAALKNISVDVIHVADQEMDCHHHHILIFNQRNNIIKEVIVLFPIIPAIGWDCRCQPPGFSSGFTLEKTREIVYINRMETK